HLLKTEGYAAGFHVGMSQVDPEVVQIRFFESPGIEISPALQKEIEKNYTRGELRRASFGDIGEISYPARVRESYAQDLLDGVDLDRAAERLYLVDERGREIPVEQSLLLFLRLIGTNGRRGKLAFPITVTSQVDRLLEGSGLEVVRTPTSLAELTKAAAQDGVIFAGAVGGGYVFPEVVPAYDAVASLCQLLELLAAVRRPLSELVADLPAATLVHRQLPCTWAGKAPVLPLLPD